MQIICYEAKEKGKKRNDGRVVDVYVDGDFYAKIKPHEERWSKKDLSILTVDPRDDDRLTFFDNADTIAEAKKLLRERLQKKPRRAVLAANLPAFEDAEFYPTPSALAGKMFSRIKWEDVHSVLEPSAGKGDLVDALLRFAENGRTFRRIREIAADKECDVIEKDPNLQFILRGKGYRLIADDFLNLQSTRRYDLILMNPPFSEGDKHLMKALMMQENGGQICCILNAETIRNPYTALRKKLVQMLMTYNARIEFIEGAFRHAERPSDVEIALITVNIPAPKRTSSILDGLKRAREEERQQAEPTAIAKTDWLEGMIDNYLLETRAGTALLEEYMALAPYIAKGTGEYERTPIIELKVGGAECRFSTDSEVINKYIFSVRKKYWRMFLYHDKLQSIVGAMPSAMLESYRDKTAEMAEYEFDEFNIRQCILDMQLQLRSGLEDAIMTLFDKLSAEHAYYPECEKNRWYYDGWKTNKAHKVGNKCIIPVNGCFADSWRHELLDDYRCFELLDDLEKIMNYLDRGDTAFHCNLQMELRRANAQNKPKVETTYFDATFYKKGTCHIKFKAEAQHIIDRLNIYAGLHRNWLPPYYGKVKYDDLDAEGRAVIDSFQGKAEYEKVCANAASFLPDDTAQVRALENNL